MTRVEEIEAEIEKLSGSELAELRDWLLEKDWDQWDRQIEAGSVRSAAAIARWEQS